MNRSPHRLLSYLPFALLTAFSFAFKFRMYPTLGGRAEMWAEGATNYFLHARHSGVWDNLVATDYGYLPWLTRAVAWAVQKAHVAPVHVPFVYQSVALLCISLCIASFSLPFFRALVPSDMVRWLVCGALLFHYDYELHTFINFLYYGVIVFFLVVAARPYLNVLSAPAVLSLGLFLAALGLSKPFFVAFAFPLAVGAVLSARRGQFRAFWVMALGLLGVQAQALVLAMNRGQVVAPESTGIGPVHKAAAAAGYYVAAVVGTLGWSWDKTLAWYYLLPGLILVGLCVGLFLRKMRRQTAGWWVLVAVSVGLASAALAVMTLPQIYASGELGRPALEHLPNRHWFTLNVVTFLSLALIFSRALASIPLRNGLVAVVLGVWMLGTSIFHPKRPPPEPGGGITGYSQWSVFGPQMPDDPGAAYCAPVNPYPWILARGCNYLVAPPPHPALDRPDTLVAPSRIEAPEGVTRGKLMWLGVAAVPEAVGPRGEVRAFGEDDRLLGTGRWLGGRSGAKMAFFRFSVADQGIEGVKRVELVDVARTIPAADGKGPLAVWLGLPR